MAAGDGFSLGLKTDGSIVAWGNSSHGQLNVPSPNRDFVAVAAGYFHSLGLKADGSIVAWGWDYWGQAGRHSLIWDGRNETGRPVASGIYFVRLRAGEYRRMQKVVVLR